MPRVGLLDDGQAAELPRLVDLDVELDRVCCPEQGEVTADVEPAAARRRLDLARLERDALQLQDFLGDRLLDARPVVVRERALPARALEDAQRRAVDVELERRVGRVRADLERGLPRGEVQEQVVDGFGCLAGHASSATESVPSSGPSRYVPGSMATHGAYRDAPAVMCPEARTSRGGASVDAATSLPRARLRSTSRAARVLAQEAGRECIAGARSCRRRPRPRGPGTRCAAARPSATAPAAPSVTTKSRPLRCATCSSSSISAASDGCRPNSPTSSSGAQRAANATGSPTSLAFVKSTARRPARPAGHHRLEEREPLPERGRRQHVAAGDRRALPRAHAEAGQHALVVALEDALAAGARGGCAARASRRARPRGTAPRPLRAMASSTTAAPASSPIGATTVTVSPGAHSRRRWTATFSPMPPARSSPRSP